MITLYAKHDPYFNTGHLGHVINEMKRQGTPTIRIMDFNGLFCATEASHRLFAAHYLKIRPKLIIEVPDCDQRTNFFWAKVVKNLPKYEFPYAYVLDLRNL